MSRLISKIIRLKTLMYKPEERISVRAPWLDVPKGRSSVFTWGQ